MICDMCSSPDVKYVYPAKTFVFLTVPETSRSVEAWAACQTCRDLIEAGDRKALVARSMNSLLDQHPEIIAYRDAAEGDMIVLHGQFFENRTGPAVEVAYA